MWQVAVDSRFRGRGLAKKMLFDLVDRVTAAGASRLETTITMDNEASQALFAALARAHGTEMSRNPCSPQTSFPARARPARSTPTRTSTPWSRCRHRAPDRVPGSSHTVTSSSVSLFSTR
ncbi:GNAT family N-acetyltransferase [Nesterenkonia pannonica]|uniref:GNAT family N-acetyltransferase n=1 Tax=Nesterenkonia pannonica TaxID=1548602 RepID=UPI002164150F|nr:GNAT family N-acetyltransferase [Nesterenkonia pannonica]